MTRIVLDAKGLLLALSAVPPQHDPSSSSDPYDWALLLREAGFDPEALEIAEPEWLPTEFAKPWLATSAFILFLAVVSATQGDGRAYAPLIALIPWALITFVMIRGGLLATMMLIFVSNTLDVPMSMPGGLGAWTGTASIATMVLVSALAVYGFWTSLAGRPLISAELLES